MLFYKHDHDQHMLPDNCTKYEQKITIITPNLAQSQILFYMHEWPMGPDDGTQY